MDPNLIIDSTKARRLLATLDLEKEATEEDIKWALSIIRQIPGYEKISLVRAAQDGILRKMLVGIAREEIAPATPRDIETLLEEAEKRERLKESAREKGEKETREFVEAAKKVAAKGAPKAPAAPAPGPAPAPTIPMAGPSIPSVEAPKISVPVSVEKGLKGQILKTRDRILFLPFQAVVAVAGPTLAKENPEMATATSLVASGFGTPQGLFFIEQKALASNASPSQIKKLVSVIQGLPAPLGYRLITGKATWADISFASFIDRRLSPAQIAAFVPSADNSTMVFSKQSFIGGIFTQIGQRVFGRAATSLLKSMIGGGAKAAVGVAAEAAGAAAGGAAGAGAGGALGALFGGIGAIPGAIVGWLVSKVPDALSWLKTHAKDFGVAAIALIIGGIFLGNTFLVAGGAGLGAVALASGGGAAISSGAQSLLQAFFTGLAVVVLPSIAVPLTISLITIPLLVAFIYYVITAGAFVAPKQIGAGPSFNLPFSLTGPLPAGAPSGWPLAGPIIQGPNSPYTHAGAAAADIITPIGTPVKSTTASFANVYDFGPFGKHVEVQTTIEGQTYTIRYAHLSVIMVTNGQTVSEGQILGLSGNSGNSDTPHLHYEFKGLPMSPPFIPKAIPEGCLGIGSCNVSAD